MSVSFAFVFIFVMVPSIALFTVIYGIFRRKKIEEKLFYRGVDYLKKLRKLLMYIQQHRGLTNSYLNGNLSVEKEIEKLELSIGAEVSNLQAMDGWVKENSKWESLTDHWLRISANYQSLDADVNLKQHNNLIANLLYFIDDLGYAHHLGRLSLAGDTDSDWRKLLFIAEYIGQARALGMGVVSKGFCSSVLRIQLNHLMIKIEASINSSWSERIKQDFHHFLIVIKEQIITDTIKIDSEEYFQLASRCIEHVLSEFDRQIENIQFNRA